MEKRELKHGDVVQLGPTTANTMFVYCFMTVTEPKSWGAQGFVQALGENGEQGGRAYYRAKFEDMEFVGHAVWAPAEVEE